MYFLRSLRLFLILIISIEFTSCSLDDNSFPEEALVKYINCNIDTITFWNRSVVYIINKPDFEVNDSLIIQSGTIIKFNPDSGRTMLISESGFISAQGNADNPIIFTSLYDSKHGKIKNKPTNVATGDWNNITIKSRKKSFFLMCNFYYGGGGNTKSTLELSKECSAMIKGCVFSYNDGGDLTTGNGVIDAKLANKQVQIKNNTFFNNSLPISISTGLNLDSTGVFHNPLDITLANKYNAIKVVTTFPMIDSIEWTENEVPYVITGPNFEVASSASLLIGNYVVLKFFNGSTLKITGKNSVLRNNEGLGVAFTSINDDSFKGDTNGDGTKTAPKSGDWNIHVANREDFEWDNIFYATKENR